MFNVTLKGLLLDVAAGVVSGVIAPRFTEIADGVMDFTERDGVWVGRKMKYYFTNPYMSMFRTSEVAAMAAGQGMPNKAPAYKLARKMYWMDADKGMVNKTVRAGISPSKYYAPDGTVHHIGYIFPESKPWGKVADEDRMQDEMERAYDAPTDYMFDDLDM